jgi:hypothetical protein
MANNMPPGIFPPDTPGLPSNTPPKPGVKQLVVQAGVVMVQTSTAEALRIQGHTGKAAALDLASAVVGGALAVFSGNKNVQNIGTALVLGPASSLGRNYGAPALAGFIPKKQEASTTSDFSSYASQGSSQGSSQNQASQTQREEVRQPAVAKAG